MKGYGNLRRQCSWLVASVFALGIAQASADTYLPLDDPSYEILRKLEAEGAVRGGVLSTLPISREAAAELAEQAERNVATRDSEYLRGLVNTLAERTAPGRRKIRLERATLEGAFQDEQSLFLDKNREGRTRPEEGVLYLRGVLEGEWRTLALHVEPEVSLRKGREGGRAGTAYLMATAGKVEAVVGKSANWWGPGMNGALLLTNNAPNFPAIKLSNSRPYSLWGTNSRATFFLGVLEEERDFSDPLIYGIRLDIALGRHVEVAISKTAIFGGEGRKEDFSTFIRSLIGSGENDEGDTGDQRAGFDIKLLFPFRLQPLELYLEIAGEDEAGGVPTKRAYVAGLYFPRLLSLEELDLLAEFTKTKVAGHPLAWYEHYLYTDGYTYGGRIIGHYIGSDAKDLYLRGRYDFGKLLLSLWYERLIREYPDTRSTGIGASISSWRSGKTEWEAYAAITGEHADNFSAGLIVRRRF